MFSVGDSFKTIKYYYVMDVCCKGRKYLFLKSKFQLHFKSLSFFLSINFELIEIFPISIEPILKRRKFPSAYASTKNTMPRKNSSQIF